MNGEDFSILTERPGVADGTFPLPITLDGVGLTEDISELVPSSLAIRARMLPLGVDDENLRVAVADPLQIEGVDELCFLTNREISIVPAPAETLNRAIERVYGGNDQATRSTNEPVVAADPAGSGDEPAPEVSQWIEPVETADSTAPIITLIREILQRAIARRASDIHFEPLEKRFRVRCRIDGAMLEIEAPPKRLQATIISRLKLMANISIAEKRVPQDGRIEVSIGGRTLDLRVSSLPTAHGESVVMRVLDRAGLKPDLAALGLAPADRRRFEQAIRAPDGLVLVTGPTGSGKTTTLYSCLQALNDVDRKIITVEDPVEYQLAGINQVPVRTDIGMTFPAALRAMLRQAPNIVMLGEIRDRETAEAAVHASLTGHMLFSTLHTNDASGAITRLVDLGVKPFFVATALRAVLAQRLVRRNCPACARPEPPPDEIARTPLTSQGGEGATFLRGAGCVECHGTGYSGRIGIFEFLSVDEALRQLIHAGTGEAQLRMAARRAGMSSLREDGWRAVRAGLTTMEEVVSITIDDRE
jgi:general secretion pathway protein E/type IV pilus assembly protein PilB